ncbi:hypothetical protein BH18ACI3_BH18ACI3_20060 [soil metagenome]
MESGSSEESMSEIFNRDRFAAAIGSTFRLIATGGQSVEIELTCRFIRGKAWLEPVLARTAGRKRDCDAHERSGAATYTYRDGDSSGEHAGSERHASSW